MAAAREPGAASWLFSAALHLLVLLCLWWSAAPQKLDTPPPLAVELWAGGAPPVPTPLPAEPAPPQPVPVTPVQPPVAKVAPPPLVPDNPAADVKLQAVKPDKIKPEATLKPPPPKPEPVKPAKPEAKPDTKQQPRPDTMAKPAAAANPAPASKAPAKPAPGVKTDDLLAELDDLPPGPGSGKVTQAGAKVGSKNGVANGQLDLKQQYGEAVRNRVRPYVVLPDGIKGNPEAVVEVIILPTLEIRSSRILRSSGSPAWDQAVLAALAEVKRFPPLPKGAEFADYRRITLHFRPKE
ncbi:MAG: energy transducer TonB [Vogesella sp.]|uniref:energy transducer TonB n=1 Tax=Vogesella sp. TaxID=1904252 RepID=UPI00391C1D59